MQLTGQALIDFEKWFWVHPENNESLKSDQLPIIKRAQLKIFYDLTDSMKYGVYVDWFDSVGRNPEIQKFKEIEAKKSGFDNWKQFIECYHRTEPGKRVISKASKESRTKEIEKGNEIYNNKTSGHGS